VAQLAEIARDQRIDGREMRRGDAYVLAG
jgi:hypothetical protein